MKKSCKKEKVFVEHWQLLLKLKRHFYRSFQKALSCLSLEKAKKQEKAGIKRARDNGYFSLGSGNF